MSAKYIYKLWPHTGGKKNTQNLTKQEKPGLGASSRSKPFSPNKENIIRYIHECLLVKCYQSNIHYYLNHFFNVTVTVKKKNVNLELGPSPFSGGSGFLDSGQ